MRVAIFFFTIQTYVIDNAVYNNQCRQAGAVAKFGRESAVRFAIRRVSLAAGTLDMIDVWGPRYNG